MSGSGPSVSSDALREPAVSVVVTNFNYVVYVVECLRSIVAQTVPPVECIVVDDASTDDSVSRVRRFIESCPPTINFQVVELHKNSGQMNAFVEGFGRSSGDFIVFVDSDDLLFPDFIETHLAAHLNTEYAAALSSSNEVIVDGSGRVLAGSIEKAARSAKPDTRIAEDVRALGVSIDQWIDTWDFAANPTFRQPAKPLIYVAAEDNRTRDFIWSTTSGTMFRRGALEFVLTDRIRDIRISADFYLLHYCHLLGGTTIIQTSHGLYRRHDSNNFATSPVVGRGTRTWKSSVAWDRDDTIRRLEDDILRDIDRLRDLMGTPRSLQVAAAFIPTRRFVDALRSIRHRPAEIALFLALLAVASIKRATMRVRQFWDFG